MTQGDIGRKYRLSQGRISTICSYMARRNARNGGSGNVTVNQTVTVN